MMKQGFDYIGVGIGALIINRECKAFLNLRGKKAYLTALKKFVQHFPNLYY